MMPGRRAIVWAGWMAVMFLLLLVFGFALHRLIALAIPAAAGPGDPFAATYSRHRLAVYLHVVPGVLFLALGPLQFIRRIRARHIRFHRWAGRVYLASGLVVGLSAISIGLRFPASGLNEGTATVFFAAIFLFCLAKAYVHIRARRIQQHREWMIRAFSVGIGVSTIRVLTFVFVVMTHASIPALLGVMFWLGFGSTLLAGEIWVNVSRPHAMTRTAEPVL